MVSIYDNRLTVYTKAINNFRRIHIFDPETIEPIAIAMARQRVVKFQKDREYVLKLLRETKMEMLRSMSFDCLMKRLMEYQTEKEEEEELLNQMRERRSQLTELQMLLEVEKVKTLDKIQMATEAIGRLKDELEVSIFHNLNMFNRCSPFPYLKEQAAMDFRIN